MNTNQIGTLSMNIRDADATKISPNCTHQENASRIHLQNSQADAFNNKAFEAYIGFNTENASANNPSETEEVPTNIMDKPETIPMFNTHLPNNRFPASQLKVPETDQMNGYHANAAEKITKFTHLANAVNVCLMNTNQTGVLSMNTHGTDTTERSPSNTQHRTASKIRLQNSQADPFKNKTFKTYTHLPNTHNVFRENNKQTGAFSMSVHEADSSKISSNNTHHANVSNNILADASEMDSKNTHQDKISLTSQDPPNIPIKPRSHTPLSKIRLQNSQADTCNIHLRNTHGRTASEEHSHNSHQANESKSRQNKVIMCEECDTKFRWEGYLMCLHHTSHPGTVYRCRICSIAYLTRGALHSHLRKIHFMKNQRACEVCNENSNCGILKDVAPGIFKGKCKSYGVPRNVPLL